MTPLLVALGAGLGAALRFAAGHHLDARLPWGTLLVNTLGSLLLGGSVGLSLDGHAFALFGAGFCGGLTTYSAFAVQTHELGRRLGTAYAAATLVLALAAVALGFVLAGG